MAKVQPGFHHVLTFSDKYDNSYRVMRNSVNGNMRVFLTLLGDSRDKMIAEVDVKHRALIMNRIKQKHFANFCMGYGFNWSLIEGRLPVKIEGVVLIEIDGDSVSHYMIHVQDIIDRGQKKHFGKGGMELQWFVPLRTLLEYKTDAVSWTMGSLIVNEKELHHTN